MNLQPIFEQLDDEDFGKMLAACASERERFFLRIARLDRSFEYHIDLPKEQKPEDRDQGTESRKPRAENPLADMAAWLADETRFPKMKWRWFHRHRFDGSRWQLVSSVEVVAKAPWEFQVRDLGKQRVFSNTCLDCGDLVFRRTQEVENQ